MKYILFQIEEGNPHEEWLGKKGDYIPVIFPNCLVHKDMMRGAMRAADAQRLEINLVSAGKINENGFCHDESETLNVKSRPEDTEIIKTVFNK